MKPARFLVAGLCSLLAATSGANADIVMLFSTGRDYLQTNPFTMGFRGGDLSVFLRDGIIVVGACTGQPSPTILAPSTSCPLGTTGFVAGGDADGDGVRDDLSFWSIADIEPALLIEPFEPEYCQLYAAPPSDLPRPLGPFRDGGVVAFYNIFTENVLQYNVSIYEFARDYPAGEAGRRAMDKQVVIGTYVFTFPRINAPTIPVGISVTHPSIPEGNTVSTYPKNSGFRFTSGYWYQGSVLFDPRFTTTVDWTGNNQSNTYAGRDEYRISILDVLPDPEDPGVMPTVIFPPSGTPLLLPNPFTQTYNLPPFFLTIGQSAFFQLRLDRSLPSSTISYDQSVRLFQFPIMAVDTYQGFRLVTFPSGSIAARTLGTADFDLDGQSNLLEFALQSNPTVKTSVGTLPIPVQDPVAEGETESTVSVTVPKRPNVANTLQYRFEVATGSGPYTLVTATNAEWEIVQDDEAGYTIRTRMAANVADYAVRLNLLELAIP